MLMIIDKLSLDKNYTFLLIAMIFEN